jgi:hypothetical protein
VIDAASLAVIDNIVRREKRSLLQYVSDAFPWTTAEEQRALGQFRKLVQEEAQEAANLVDFLRGQRHVLPYVGTYPEAFTSINYVSLEHVLPLLIEHERRGIFDLERDLRGIHDSQASDLVQGFLDMKRRHLQALEVMAAAYPETQSTVRGRAS